MKNTGREAVWVEKWFSKGLHWSNNSYRSFWSAWPATSANEILVLRHVFRFEADAEQVEPELAAVALYPMNLQNEKKERYGLHSLRKN